MIWKNFKKHEITNSMRIIFGRKISLWKHARAQNMKNEIKCSMVNPEGKRATITIKNNPKIMLFPEAVIFFSKEKKFFIQLKIFSNNNLKILWDIVGSLCSVKDSCKSFFFLGEMNDAIFSRKFLKFLVQRSVRRMKRIVPTMHNSKSGTKLKTTE